MYNKRNVKFEQKHSSAKMESLSAFYKFCLILATRAKNCNEAGRKSETSYYGNAMGFFGSHGTMEQCECVYCVCRFTYFNVFLI